ncbi:MAG: hypothetical protein JO272_08660 [Pseudonocardiales bacterium]|nr:hypothetical protein [Pseudonocardiales bacterium]
MSRVVRWALSPRDCRVHLLVSAGDLPWGVLKARCGQVLPPGVARQQVGFPWAAHRTCATCAEIAKRPCSVPADRWVCPQDTLEDQSVRPAAGRPNTVREMWVRCRVDQHLHLLSARAALELAAMGCTVACCGALIITQELVLGGGGTACGMCLAVGCA